VTLGRWAALARTASGSAPGHAGPRSRGRGSPASRAREQGGGPAPPGDEQEHPRNTRCGAEATAQQDTDRVRAEHGPERDAQDRQPPEDAGGRAWTGECRLDVVALRGVGGERLRHAFEHPDERRAELMRGLGGCDHGGGPLDQAQPLTCHGSASSRARHPTA